jgi:hypothetical protein
MALDNTKESRIVEVEEVAKQKVETKSANKLTFKHVRASVSLKGHYLIL